MRKEEWRIAGLPAVYALKQIVLDAMREAVRMRMSAVFYPAVWKRELRAVMRVVNFHAMRKCCRKKGSGIQPLYAKDGSGAGHGLFKAE